MNQTTTDDALDQIINRSMSELHTPKIVDYKVATGTSPNELGASVLALQIEGYVLQGGVSHTYFCFQPSSERTPVDLWSYAQAMVLFDDGELTDE